MMQAYWLFTMMAVFTVASPGPGVLMTLDNTIACGWWRAMYGVLGLALGAALMASLSSAGVGLLVRSSPVLFAISKYCGVAYLLYLAYKTWNRPAPAAGQGQAGSAGGDQAGGAGLLLRGILLQTSNPKSLLFFLSVLPHVVPAQGSASLPHLVLAIGTYCVALLLIHALYAGLAARARRWLARPQTARWLSRISAAAFLLFSILMLKLNF